MVLNILYPVFAYLAGSISSAILVCKVLGKEDPRTVGSGNPGATNVLRMHGKKAALFTLSGDVLKGLLPVLLASLSGMPDSIVALTGLMAFIGHLYPIFFNFKGGKGVATLIGILFASHWLLGIVYVASWMLVAVLFRYSSLAALTAALFTPVYTWLILDHMAYVICYSSIAVILIWRHTSNIQNLIAGKENKIVIRKN